MAKSKAKESAAFRNKDGAVLIYSDVAGVAAHGKGAILHLAGGGTVIVDEAPEAVDAILGGEAPPESE